MHERWNGTGAGTDQDLEAWIEADLQRLDRQREASQHAVASAHAWESRCLERLLPVSARLADRFREVEQRTRAVRSCRHHEVVVRLRQPSPACVSVSLRWGAKFGLTDAERHLMRSYQRGPRRLWRYPAVVVAHEYHELSAVLDGDAESVRFGSGPLHPLTHVLSRPSIVDDYLATGLAHPPLFAAYHHRSDGYRERPA